MGNCRYCGKPAGFMRHQHPECRARHNEAVAKIQGSLVHAFQNSIDPNRFHELIDQDAAQNFISVAERDQLIRCGIASIIQSALANGPLNDAVDRRISEFQKSFHLSMDAFGSAGIALAKARILKALDLGHPPPRVEIDGPYVPRLQADESALWCFSSVRYFTFRTRTRYVGGSMGMSVRIARGVYLRATDFRGEPIRTEYLNMEDSGGLTLTMRNLYFVGHHHALKIPVRKILSAQLHGDSIEILQNGANAKPAIFMIDDPAFAANLLSHLHSE
jgi:hypothetical protein